MIRRGLLLAGLMAAAPALSADEARAGLVDCFADEVVWFAGGYVPPTAGQRVAELPGIVIGPPGDSFPNTGSVSTVSLGRGGSILVSFTDNLIVDEPGPDFIVFENAFFKSFTPTDPNQAYTVFAEPASVAVSDDGVTFHTFPYDPTALALVGQDATPSTALESLRGLAGITPTFTGDYTVADDPGAWDASGPGGVSGAGGDAFDLADLGLSSARYVLITDLGLATGFAGPAEGFDLDSVVALHAIPVTAGPDTDGDGLPDADETAWYGTNPADPDTDKDSVPDGREAARCRNPVAAAAGPWFVPEIDLTAMVVAGAADTAVVWSFVSSTASYDVVRGLLPIPPGPLPGEVVCIEDNSFNLSSADHPDGTVPPPGRALFYLVRPKGSVGYGKATGGAPRLFATGDCPP